MKPVNIDDVLKILYKYGKYIFVTDEKRYSSMVDEIANLKALRSSENLNRWIPCSERFPDEVGAYIVTVRDKKIPEITGTRIDIWCLDYDKYRWNKYENPYGDNEYEIVAWMPLPEPYKEAENDI